MISQEMADALNEQINKELFSSYLYLSMSAWFEEEGLPGCASWMRSQTWEEKDHAMKLYYYVIEAGGRVILDAIEKPEAEFGSPTEAFEAALEHEQFITGSINDLVDKAIELKDHATNNFLQWYVEEQVEEEDAVQEILDKLKWAEESGGAMLQLDRELGQRTYTPMPLGDEAEQAGGAE